MISEATIASCQCGCLREPLSARAGEHRERHERFELYVADHARLEAHDFHPLTARRRIEVIAQESDPTCAPSAICRMAEHVAMPAHAANHR